MKPHMTFSLPGTAGSPESSEEPGSSSTTTEASPEALGRIRLTAAVRWRRHYASHPALPLALAGLESLLSADRLTPELRAELEGHLDGLRASLRTSSRDT